jgi:hypothetical protein
LWSDDFERTSREPYRDIPLSPCKVVGPISLQDIQNGQKLVGRCVRFFLSKTDATLYAGKSRIDYAFYSNCFSQWGAARDRIGLAILASDQGQASKDSGVWMGFPGFTTDSQPGGKAIRSLGYGRLQRDVTPLTRKFSCSCISSSLADATRSSESEWELQTKKSDLKLYGRTTEAMQVQQSASLCRTLTGNCRYNQTIALLCSCLAGDRPTDPTMMMHSAVGSEPLSWPETPLGWRSGGGRHCLCGRLTFPTLNTPSSSFHPILSSTNSHPLSSTTTTSSFPPSVFLLSLPIWDIRITNSLCSRFPPHSFVNKTPRVFRTARHSFSGPDHIPLAIRRPFLDTVDLHSIIRVAFWSIHCYKIAHFLTYFATQFTAKVAPSFKPHYHHHQ